MPKVEIKRDLLDILDRTNGFVTAKDLSNRLSVSTKTIYRTIDQINESIGEPSLIITAKGKGIQLNHERNMDHVVHFKELAPNDGLSPRKRREQITIRLLYLSPRKLRLQFLVEQYFISESVINSDERMINQWLKQFQLKLTRENREIGIVGNESQIRKAISALTDFSGIIDFSNIESDGSISLNERDVHFVSKLMKNVESRLQIEIPYPYDVNIFSHIYILINRYRNVGTHGSIISNTDVIDDGVDSQLYECAKWMIEKIKLYTNFKIPISEIMYIYEYLESSRITHLTTRPQRVPEIALNIAEMYVSEVGDRLKIGVQNENLMTDLINHIRPMLNRLSNGIYAKNELLQQIEEEYPDIFQTVENVSMDISQKFKLPAIPKDEIGFISIYFAKEVEKVKQPLNILVACTTGVGTAELLRVKLEKLFPELRIKDVISIRGYQEHKKLYGNIDLIVSTVPLKNETETPNIVVSALLGKQDQVKIHEIINEIVSD